MSVDAVGLAELLIDTFLGGREVVPTETSALVVRCTAEEVWQAWQAARSVFTRFPADEPMDHQEPERAAADELLTSQDVETLRATRASTHQCERLTLNRRTERSQLSPEGDTYLRWTERGRTWFTPRGEQYAVAFVEADTTWEAGAQPWLFGALDGDTYAALVAAEREWSERYGPELVASWNTML